ncbi:uncharacterized protein LOC129732014 [Wyeomyia smithii]|uniref:uncharacterized protein LOC129732014 n=1 Tax=Wyeomyia smithii TaxID=174621 RepID=UPI002467F970|nr:uncharacterized protein LOC129732014 [Wyeomyia smithii]
MLSSTPKELSEPLQLDLAEVIAKYHLNNKHSLRKENLESYALVVTSLFKHERKENYNIEKGGDRKNPGREIANKIGNLKQRKRKRDNKENEYQRNIQYYNHEPEKIQKRKVLQNGMLNEDPWAVVLEQWKCSFDVRKTELLSGQKADHFIVHYPSLHC